MSVKISVISPVYNVNKYLDEFISSVLALKFSDFELILVDDGSTDNSGEICDEWAKKDSRIKVIHQKNGGLPNARNTGINNASGSYIAFVDSDDWVDKNFLSVMYDAITEYDADFVQCNFVRKMSDEDYFFRFNQEIWSEEYIKSDVLPKVFNYKKINMSNSRWNKLYKSGIVKKAVHLCDESVSMGEDFLMNAAVLPLCRKVVILDTPPLYFYRFNQKSISVSYSPDKKDSNKKFFQNIKSIAGFYGYNTDDLSQEENRQYGSLIFECAVSDLSKKDKKKEIKNIIALTDKKIWRRNIKNYRTFAERLCMYMVYFHLTDLMLLLVNIRKKAGTKGK